MQRLVFDAQVFQTPALYRGMGKYSLELIKALSIQNRTEQSWSSIELIISSKFSLDDQVKNQLQSLDNVEIKELALSQNDILHPDVTSSDNRKIIDKYIDETGDNVTYVVLSLMQGEISSTFPSSKNVKCAVLFYDLIPLIFHKTYLQNPITRKEYLSKLSELFMADIFLAISKTVANDLSIYLGVDPSRIVSIDGGPINHDSHTDKIEVVKPYILMPTGNDLRKNNHRAIEGFEIFNRKHDHKYTLVITSYFKDEQIQELSELSNNLVFTGNISGAKLNYLYDNAKLLLFPSEYEGLGLPVLEALEHKLKVACSDITVFREISSTNFSFFDPMLAYSIADGLESAFDSKIDSLEISRILEKYTWKNTATLTNLALKKDIGCISAPFPSVNIISSDYSGSSLVGKFILQSHAELSRIYTLNYYEAHNSRAIERRINFLPYITNFRYLSSEQAVFADDSHINVYHLSNRETDSLILLNALSVPGILVLHNAEQSNVWADALNNNFISKERYGLEEEINLLSTSSKGSWVVSLLSIQKKVIVFSEANYNKIKSIKKSLNLKFELTLVSLPSNNLVYPEIISKQKKTIERDELMNLDDVYYESKLSQSKIKQGVISDESSEDILLKLELEKYNDKTRGGYGAFAVELSAEISKIAGN